VHVPTHRAASVQPHKFARQLAAADKVKCAAHLMLLSSLLEMMRSWRAWNITQLTLLVWPRSVSTSHALLSTAAAASRTPGPAYNQVQNTTS
jgi:hypothetical protein